MRRRQMAQQVLKGLFLMVLTLASCSAPSDDGVGGGCGGSEAAITCLDVTSIVPTSLNKDTTNVDALRDTCPDQTPEPFETHNANITLVNKKFPTTTTTDRAFDIRIIGYSVTYTLNGRCPAASLGCPPLTGLPPVSTSITIPAGGPPLPVTLPFVPLSTKNEYIQAGGERRITSAPSYTATYTFTAQTIGLNDTFTFQGSAQFTIADFDNCP